MTAVDSVLWQISSQHQFSFLETSALRGLYYFHHHPEDVAYLNVDQCICSPTFAVAAAKLVSIFSLIIRARTKKLLKDRMYYQRNL